MDEDEILPGPNTGIRISGFPHRLQANDTISDRRETEVSNITMQEAVGCPTDHDSTTCSRNWSNDLDETSNPASPSPLQSPPRVEKHCSEPPPLIRCSNYSDTDFQAGSGVVDTSLETMEIAGYPTTETPLTLESDASNLGWGAVCLKQNTSTGGVWGKQEMSLHINYKELLAGWLGLQCYASNLRNTHVHLKIDNTAAVAHINKMGGVHSKHLYSLALEVWDWCLC